ncbi:MAG: uncharacterized protein PWR13_1304 [Archaeoglobi archaeon]|nr:DUF504 domain-containing protein [Candidatus Mnemosynella bozhongmuii]MDI3502177.1 uncharacterized protein [Archaeoglobi archaeon]MDK2782276.1 uncharacterized protein [Archaeoglobi archaeon]
MIRSRTPKEILNEIKWRGLNLEDCEIVYLHRGAPGDRKVVSAGEIEGIEGGFMIIRGKMIPFHRVLEIRFKGETVFKRRRT